MVETYSGENIDDFEFSIYQIHWTLDSENAYRIRPFIDLDGSNYVGYLDDLSRAEKPKSEQTFTTDMILEAIYRLTSSNNQRMLLLDYDTRITVDFKLFRKEALELAELYTKFAKKYALHQDMQNKMFDIASIDKRLNLLSRGTFENKDIFWHMQQDDPTMIRPFLRLKNNKAGYLDNCEILGLPEKTRVLSSQQLADYLMQLLHANEKREKILDSMYEQLSLEQRLSQKALARICQIYHETAEKYVDRQTVINTSFKNFES